jgi:hypothetical protein
MASLLAGVSCFQLTGDEKYLELPRNQINVIMSLGACVLGVPNKSYYCELHNEQRPKPAALFLLFSGAILQLAPAQSDFRSEIGR